jgi:hypothetical protein
MMMWEISPWPPLDRATLFLDISVVEEFKKSFASKDKTIDVLSVEQIQQRLLKEWLLVTGQVN